METFESGVSSGYNTHIFQQGEHGMKCLACHRIMTINEWTERQRCFCQSTNAIPAIALAPTRLQTNGRTGINSTRISNNPNSNTIRPIVNQRNERPSIGRNDLTRISNTPTNPQVPTLNRVSRDNGNYGYLIKTIPMILILSAIGLPLFFNQAKKAKQSEAKQYVDSINKEQQALFVEKTLFTSKISDLGSGMKSETKNYKYSISKLSNNSAVVAIAQPKVSGIKGYIGIVFASETNIKLPEVNTSTLICEQSQVSNVLANISKIISKNTINCPENYNLISSTLPQLTPKQVITKYYQLVTSNQAESKVFLSDNWKINNTGKSNFWNSIKRVQTYAFQTKQKSRNSHQIRVWLQYLDTNNNTSCENMVVEVILNSTKDKWLINKVYDVQYDSYCEVNLN